MIGPDSGTVLDFARGRFFGLDVIGTKMLALTLENGPHAAVAHLTREYDASEDLIERDLKAMLQTLAEKRLIVLATPGQRFGLRTFLHTILNWAAWLPGLLFMVPLHIIANADSRLRLGRKEPSRFQVGLLLTLAWFSLRLLGWHRSLIVWGQKHAIEKTEVNAGVTEILAAVDHLVRAVAARKLLFPVACKERALVGYYLLRVIYGLPATLIVGFDCYPFRGHAWVECAGRVLTDDFDHCEQFTPVARYN